MSLDQGPAGLPIGEWLKPPQPPVLGIHPDYDLVLKSELAELRADRERLDEVHRNGWDCPCVFLDGKSRFGVRKTSDCLAIWDDSPRAAIDKARGAA